MAKRLLFSSEDREELETAYKEGMNSTRREMLPQIQSVAKKLKRDEQDIKNWIGNKRRKEKEAEPSCQRPPKKPPQKLRAPNPYNLFVKDFFKSDEGARIKDLGAKNTAAASKWNVLDSEEKSRYHQLAAQVPIPQPDVSSYDQWHETQRVLSNMQDNCEWAEKMGVQMFYVLCNNKNHYVGGTSQGREFLSSNPHIPASFHISTKPGLSPAPPSADGLSLSLKELRKLVQEHLNTKYSLAVGEPHAKIPYRQLQPQNVTGLPPGITQLGHPSTMSQEQLKGLLKNIASVKFVGVPPIASDHSYAKVGPSQLPQQSDHTGYTTLATVGGSASVVGPLTTATDTAEAEEVTLGQTINLLSSKYKVVGTANTLSGGTLHGHPVQPGFVKVAVKTINKDTEPWPGVGEDEPLTIGSITAWPLKFTRKVKL